MSTFEKPAPQPESDPNINIWLPYGIDDEWCADFNAIYGYRGKRTLVPAVWIMRDPNYSYLNRTTVRNYESELLANSTQDPLLLDGEVVSLRLVPCWGEDGYEYLPHLTMRDVIDQTGGPVTSNYEEIWVQTEQGEELRLY